MTVSPATDVARRRVLRQLLRNPQGAVCLAFLALVVLVAVTSPWLAPYSPTETDLDATNAAPFSAGHLLGGDSAGRDILSRLMWGSRQTVLACAIILVISLAVGVTSGLVAGFYRGRFEAAAGFVSDVVMSLPGIVLLIALYALTGPNIPAAMAVFGLLIAPSYYRLVRNVVLGVRNELYVDAARVAGLSDLRIVGRHVLWAVRAPVIIQSSFVLAAGIGIEAGVSFLGLGDPAGASWGIVLQNSFNGIYNNRWAVVWPALLISLTILALVLLGNALSDVLQSSARSKTLSPRARRAAVTAARQAEPEEDSILVGSSDDVVLSVRGLRVAYPMAGGEIREVVHGADLDVRRGEIHGLVGESGSGKSQIAFAALGILPREALVLDGSVLLDGDDLLADDAKMRAARGRRIAYVPQEPMSNLDPSFTIGKQLTYGLRAVTTLDAKQARERITELLIRVGITDPERVMGLYPHEISGGMAQRVLICGAVAADPDVIVADEPTTALDVTVQAEVLELLRELSQERGLAMILVTHNLGVVADLCDTVSVMKEGNIVERADVDAIFESPQQAYTQELLSSSRSVELMEI
ncbi:dipeptide/oligopeptide/nickel ABC transporter permease/ATP-binding protein [Actinoplanes sp. NPDC051513]|uniref:dipeptide/oligopeptide/nickel ABC transporter permease/ATP-binding protein n=1 Tax=Actinoplanes sp. NPDC051513 TaxID=3363908 RepID=UPI0037A885E4